MSNELVPLTEDLSNRIVAQDNDLIASVAEMRQMPLKIFEIAVGALDANREEPEKHRSVRIKKKVVFDLLGQGDRNRDRRLRDTMETLMREARFHMMLDDERHEKIIAPIEAVGWSKDSDEISLTFTPTILPYITLLQRNFTQYKLEYVARMSSKHAIVLYKLLAKEYNQYKYYKKKGVLTPQQEEKFTHPQYTLAQLKRWTGTEGKYAEVGKFRKRVLDVAMRDINKCSDMHVDYENIRTGHSISGFQFNITGRDVAPALSTAKKDTKETQETDAQALMAAMQSPYTQKLITWELLSPADMARPEIMIALHKMVYPQYDELAKGMGKQQVDKHLEYVKKRYRAHPHGNVAHYLNTAITGYLQKMKSENDFDRVSSK